MISDPKQGPSGSAWYLVHPGVAGGISDGSEALREAMANLGVNVHCVELAQGSASLRPESGDVVLLQYSGYGYARRGAPFWLLERMKGWRAARARIGVIFHELYAVGPPWRSSFWLSTAQRHVARAAARLSDFWLTNRVASERWLEQYADGKPHFNLPAFSNVGEALSPRPERAEWVTVFGSGQLRAQTYEHLGDLTTWARQQGVEIHDVGPPIANADLVRTLMQSKVVGHGHLPARRVSELLSVSRYGVVSYPAEFVAKSGVFAAYCAHRVCPIVMSAGRSSEDRLEAGVHYLESLPRHPIGSLHSSTIAASAWAWYQPHSINKHVETLHRLAEASVLASASP